MTARGSDLAGRWRPSPNCGARAEGMRPELLILHYTDMPTAEGAIDWLCNPSARVSSHYVVAEDGSITQLVAEADRAWHAGVAMWQGESDINSLSIGIEICNPGHDHGYPDFTDPQIEAVIALSRDIIARHGIRPESVLAHSDVAPARKRDPGEKFPWARLAAAGVGHYVAPEPIGSGRLLQRGDLGIAVGGLQMMLRLYGYGIAVTGEYDLATEQVVQAFQRHFRPALVDGIADASTLATLRRLASALAPEGRPTFVTPVPRRRA